MAHGQSGAPPAQQPPQARAARRHSTIKRTAGAKGAAGAARPPAAARAPRGPPRAKRARSGGGRLVERPFAGWRAALADDLVGVVLDLEAVVVPGGVEGTNMRERG